METSESSIQLKFLRITIKQNKENIREVINTMAGRIPKWPPKIFPPNPETMKMRAFALIMLYYIQKDFVL